MNRTHESEEMYLETILLIKKRKGNVRSVDVAEELGYAKSSVSRGVNLLLEKGYINIGKGGDITFTEIHGSEQGGRGGERLPHRTRHFRRALRGAARLRRLFVTFENGNCVCADAYAAPRALRMYRC